MKEYLSLGVANSLGDDLQRVWPEADTRTYQKHVAADYEALSIKERAFRIAEALKEALPAAYPEALATLLNMLPPPFENEENITTKGFRYWPLACFIEAYGLDHPEVSLSGMHEVTQRFSAEFAIRPYLQKDPEGVFKRLQQWVNDPSLHVRRLVSEGTRPRLPWGSRLPEFLTGSANILPLLDQLREDPELYVRRSVANHVNDLTKSHPNLVLDILESWNKNAGEHTPWVVRHGLRSMVKAGNPRALAMLGFEPARVAIHKFLTVPETLTIGEAVSLHLEVYNAGKHSASLAIDAVFHFVKANGTTSEKVFKWATPELAPGASVALSKAFPMLQRTTRRLYSGTHRVEVQINGERLAETTFVLTEP